MLFLVTIYCSLFTVPVADNLKRNRIFIISFSIVNFGYYERMGRRQAVRHKILVLAYGGSNPPAPAKYIKTVFGRNVHA